MPLYITTGDPRDREVIPLHTLPDTMIKLFYLSIRDHLRTAAIRRWENEQWEDDPDWRFDRQVIRTGLYLRERLGVAESDRVAIHGKIDPLWLQVDLGVQGIRAIPVGLHDGLSSDELVGAVLDTGCDVALATDESSAARLVELYEAGHLKHVIVPVEPSDAVAGVVSIDAMRELSATLDTAERARQFYDLANTATPKDVAGIHFSPGDGESPFKEEFTHEQAMLFVHDRVGRCPAQQGDVALFQTTSVTTATRLSYQTAIGDGYTTVVLPGREAGNQIREMQPAKIVASADWVERLCSDLASVASNGGGKKIRERLHQEVGEHIRWIEPADPISPDCEKQLAAAGVPIAGVPIS